MLVVELLLFAYFLFNVLYVFFFALAAKLKGKPAAVELLPASKSFCILIPSYKEDSVILHTAERMLLQNYPAHLFRVVVIADSLKPHTLSALAALPVSVIEVKFEKSTKAKSINEAIRQIEGSFDVVVISDADNFFDKNFLLKVNTDFENGEIAVQTQRVAKNLNTSFAILDAASEMIGNQIFRKGANATGLSSSVIGSGMAFEYNFFKNSMSSVEAVGGFDKVLQLAVVDQGVKIHYLEQAITFDEKIDNKEAFENQRRRWISAQFIYLRKYFLPACGKLFKGNIDYFNLAVLNNLVLPRVLLIGLLPLISLVYFCLFRFVQVSPFAWLSLTFVYAFSLLICLPAAFYNRRLLLSVLEIPVAIFTMVLAILRLKTANKSFIHTDHSVKEIDNPLFNEYER